MLKTILAATALTVLIGTAPTLAQEQPAATPAPETEQAPPAKTDTATAETTKKPEPAAHPHRVHHTQLGRYYWPWDWAFYQLRRELRYLQHHKV